jgi:CubicO group peptidase (beta-lactamase class C family)
MEGECEAGFAPLREAFAANFARHGELGAAVAVVHRGRLAVDLWGGQRDPAGAPWRRDTIVNTMSISKGIAMLCVALLAERGLLSLDDRMAQHWPEFAQNGKAMVTVRQALGHLACIPATDAARPGDCYDWAAMTAAIAAQAPLWPIGTRQVYHSATLGYMAGELVRRITGHSIGAFLQDEIAAPLGADFRFGLAAADQARCATVVASRHNSVNAAKDAAADSIEARMWANLPADEDYNSARYRGAEIPSINGHGTARAIATIYGAVATGAPPVPRLATLAPFLVEQKPDPIPPEGLRLRMAVGFMLNSPPGRPMGPNMGAFGHTGAGGWQGFCDPAAGIGFAYVGNRMHDGRENGPRASALIDALARCPALVG